MRGQWHIPRTLPSPSRVVEYTIRCKFLSLGFRCMRAFPVINTDTDVLVVLTDTHAWRSQQLALVHFSTLIIRRPLQ